MLCELLTLRCIVRAKKSFPFSVPLLENGTKSKLPTLPQATMPKRKYDETDNSKPTSTSATARSLRLQRLEFDTQLSLSKKTLSRSLKTSRGFERQKLGRRLKTAKSSNNTPDISRLDAEVAALKSLDLASVAEIHLYKTLLKTKSIATAPSFPHHVQATVEGLKKPQETASANVQARLFKSGPVRAAMTEALKGVRAVLGIEEVKSKGRKRMRAKDYEDIDEFGRANSKRVRSSTSTTGAPKKEEWSGLSAQESSENDEDQGLGKENKEGEEEEEEEEEEVDYNSYTSRLAQSSDEESINEDAEGQDHDRDELNDMSITDEEPSEHHHQKDSPISPIQPPLPASKPPIPIPKRNPPHTSPPKTTTFLPSLSLSGYWSGSDTSTSSSSSPSSPKLRRNRMGQQARRALWERKYGQNANHVKTQTHIHDRNQGWDPRRGAQGVDDGVGKRGRGRGRGFVDTRRGRGGGGRRDDSDKGRYAQRTGANSDPVIARKTVAKSVTEGPLHPSWEAARKAKEQKKGVPFQGKKVVFS